MSKILLDTSSYLRLAYPIDPLLRRPFGKNGDELFVLPDLDQEYRASPRLRNDFLWVSEVPYIQNRREGRLNIRDPKKGELNRTLEMMTRIAETEGIGVSPTDIKCLACAYVLRIQVVTDDLDMHSLAKEFEVETLTSLELLQRMMNESYMTRKQIEDVVRYWIHVDDLPSNWRSEFRRLFHSDPP